jgi:hypothetical protein
MVPTANTKLHVQMVFLMMNTCFKNAEDTKKWIKSLIWKVWISWFTVHKTKQIWEVEGSNQACRVTKTGSGSTFKTLCGQTCERERWWVRNVWVGVKCAISI